MGLVLGKIARVPANGIIRFNCSKPSPFEGKWPGLGRRNDPLSDEDKAGLKRISKLESVGHRERKFGQVERAGGKRKQGRGREKETVHSQTPGYSKAQLDYLSTQHPKDAKRNSQFDGRTYYYANVGSNTLHMMIFKAKKFDDIVSCLAKYDNYSIYPTNEMQEVSESFTSLHILHGKWERPDKPMKSLHEQMAGPITSNGLVNAVVNKFAERDVIYITHETKAKYYERCGYTRLGKWDGGTLSQLSYFLLNHKHLTESSRSSRARGGVDNVIAATGFAVNVASMFR